MSEFLSMGGYAQFVWPSYGLTLIVLAMNLIIAWQQNKQLKRTLKRRLKNSQ
ncbi:MAG: heme exporter protein CcmD [Gammaproteobacteria bacterium]|nr:heme exporter protein CcmD [Gammaproteobacteria bacterium]